MGIKRLFLIVTFFCLALQLDKDPNVDWAKKKIEEFKSSVTFSGLVPRDYIKGQDIEFTVCLCKENEQEPRILFYLYLIFVFYFTLFCYFIFVLCIHE